MSDPSARMAYPIGPCGHAHQLWNFPFGYRVVEPSIWRVSSGLAAWPKPHPGDPPYARLSLPPGTLLRHDQSDHVRQGCAGAEDEKTWERFAVLNGPHAGRCVVFQRDNPGLYENAIPAELEPEPEAAGVERQDGHPLP